MTHDARESSRTQGAPITLYLFRGGTEAIPEGGFDPGDVGPYAYTDADEPVTRTCFGEEIIFIPIMVSADAVKSSGSTDKATRVITLPQTASVRSEFQTFPPSQPVYVFEWEGHVGEDPDTFPARYVGKVLSWKVNSPHLELTCEGSGTSVRRPVLNRNWQHGCPLALYSQGVGQCNADKAAATITVAATAVGATSVTFAAAWFGSIAAAKYVGGMVGWSDGTRNILRTVIGLADAGLTLKLSGPTTGLSATDDVEVTLGCNHKHGTGGDCIELHDNGPNYGGQKWIPTVNPIGNVNNFY